MREEQLEALRKQAVEEGILIKLNEYKLPGCYLHRTDPDDVARVEDRTFICCEREEDAGPTNHWMDPRKCTRRCTLSPSGGPKGRTMYVIPYSMSIIGSPFAKYGFELTDSIYVVLNMAIMTRIGKAVCDALGDDTGFIKGLHCQCNLDKENKYIVHFPQDNTIISMNSNYGGNVLQGKKCFALRIASNLGRQEGWMAEHMLILGIQNPRGEIEITSAAFPSACGKTNLAMLIPPEGLQRWGWRVWCVGDDIAWLRIGKDGRLWAVNPENGFFGVAPGTSMKSNPNALISTHKDTIFTNVALDLSDNTVWWEGLNKTPARPRDRLAGRPWTPQSPGKGGASQQPLHRARPQLPLPQPRVRQSRGRAHQRHHLRRPPRQDRAAGLPVLQLAARRVRRLHHGVGDHRRRDRSGRRRAPRPHGDAALLRLPHGRLLAALAGYGQEDPAPAQDLQRQLVPYRRRGSLRLARLRRQYARAAVDHLPARTMRSGAAETALGYEPNTTTSTWRALKCPCTICAACSPSTVTFGCRSAPMPAPTTRRSAKVPEELYEELDALEMRLNRGYKRK